jgi:hypothetical protein
MKSFEDRFAAVEEKFRSGPEAAPAKTTDSPFVVRLKEKVADLEKKLVSAQAAGRATGDLQAQLETQRAWLAQAGVVVDAPAPAVEAPAAPAKKSTTAWVRADS